MAQHNEIVPLVAGSAFHSRVYVTENLYENVNLLAFG